MHSPAIQADEDIVQLVNDIYGVSPRPARGAPPKIVEAGTNVTTGYSLAAAAVARLLVERTELALFAERYGWEPRRLNPVITYLLERVSQLMPMNST
jgi:hypothetical protein